MRDIYISVKLKLICEHNCNVVNIVHSSVHFLFLILCEFHWCSIGFNIYINCKIQHSSYINIKEIKLIQFAIELTLNECAKYFS